MIRLIEHGKRFETGRPVCFRFVRNTESAPYFGARFQQDIEPAGLYLLHQPDPHNLPGWAVGECCFDNPLVIPANTQPDAPIYNDTSWKANLAREYKAKRKKLSQKLRQKGYDGIVTVALGLDEQPIDTREIVALAPNACKIERVGR